MEVVNNKIEEMSKEWTAFCQTLRMDHWKKALKVWGKLDTIGFPQPLPKANTKELF